MRSTTCPRVHWGWKYPIRESGAADLWNLSRNLNSFMLCSRLQREADNTCLNRELQIWCLCISKMNVYLKSHFVEILMKPKSENIRGERFHTRKSPGVCYVLLWGYKTQNLRYLPNYKMICLHTKCWPFLRL